MSFTFVTSASNVASASATTLDASISPTAGHMLVAYVKWEDVAATASVADSAGGNTFTGATAGVHTNGTTHGQFFYLFSAGSGITAIRFTLSTGAPFRSVIVFEHSYTGGTPTLDTEGGSEGGQFDSVTSGNITTTGTDELAFGGYSEYSANQVTAATINGSAFDNSVRLNATCYTAMWSKAFGSTFTGAAAATVNPADWICRAIAFKIAAGANAIAGVAPETFGLQSSMFGLGILAGTSDI